MTDIYKTTLVRIMGEDYPIKSDADSEYMRKLAKHVEDAIQGVSSRMKLPPHLKPEVLAALVIADAYFSEKEKNAEIERRMSHLVSVLEEGLDRDMVD